MGMRTVMLCSISVAWALTLVAIAHRPDLTDEPRANNVLKGPMSVDRAGPEVAGWSPKRRD
jgi:hypothetical protein